MKSTKTRFFGLLTVLFLTGLIVSHSYADEIPFPPRQIIDDAFDGASSVVTGDLDGDGDIDVIAAAYDEDTIAWWENTGSGWSKQIIDNAFEGANDVYIADIDGDGHLDVLGAASQADTLSWWEKTGATWDEQAITTTFNGAWQISSADVDGDGDLDVLGAAWDGDAIVWWENLNGNALSWTEHLVDNTFNQASSVIAADMDSDGDLDILGSANIDDDIVWWENITGDGSTWDEHLIDGQVDGATSAIAVDLDGDGDLDVLGSAANADEISWWENTDSNGQSWLEHSIEQFFDGAWQVHAADLDHDGDMDIVGAAQFGDDVTWWENSPDGFIPHPVDEDFDGARSITTSDLDSDGDLDILGAARNGDLIAWWENTSNTPTATPTGTLFPTATSTETATSTHTPTATNTPAPAGVTIVVDPETVNADQTFSVSVVVNAGAQEVDGASAYLNFDKDVVQIVSMTGGSSFQFELLNSFDNNAGTIDFAAGSFSNLPSGTIALVEIEFEAIIATSGSELAFEFAAPRQTDVTNGGASVLTGHTDGIITYTSDGPSPTPTNTPTPSVTPTTTSTGHISLAIDTPQDVSVADTVWIPIQLQGVEESDDLVGVQLHVQSTDRTLFGPAGDLVPRLVDFDAPYTYSVPITDTWTFVITNNDDNISGSGVIVELPFKARDEGCVHLDFAEHVLTDSQGKELNHDVLPSEWLCVGDRDTVAGTVLLERRPVDSHHGSLIRLAGPRDTYETYSDENGNYTFNDVQRGAYTLYLSHSLFLYEQQSITVDSAQIISDTTLCVGDMDGEGDIDKRDRGILAAGIIPVGHLPFDLNASGQTNVADQVILEGNFGLIAPTNCNPENLLTRSTIPLPADEKALNLKQRETKQRFSLSAPKNQDNIYTTTLRAVNVTGTIEAVGVFLTLPEGVTVVDVKPSEAFTEGYLSWDTQDEKLSIVAAPPENAMPTQDTEIVRLELNIPETNSAITVEIEAMNRVGWEGDLIVGGTMNHMLHLPLIQR